jgi:hypothetical protein
MSVIKNDNYFVVKGWMMNELGLSGGSLIAYAVIYGFSQDNNSSFRGSVPYLASCAGVSRRGMTYILGDLLEKGYITKENTDDNPCNEYRAVNREDIPKEAGVKKVRRGGEKSSPNIISILDSKETHTDQARVENPQDNKKDYIKLWQSNPDVFNPLATLKNPQDFDDWFEKSDTPFEIIKTALKNFVDGVRDGTIERRFIPGHPDTFILNGGIQRYQTLCRNRSPPDQVNDWSNFGKPLEGSIDVNALYIQFGLTGTEAEKRRKLIELREHGGISF